MSKTPAFASVDEWQAALGLLGVPLRETASNGRRYVLMNGTTGNFCLDLDGGIDSSSQRSTAWSCDVGHYITCSDDSIAINRWDRRDPTEKYSLHSVVTQLHELHRHLEKTAPNRSKNIASHVLRIFRHIRATLDEHHGAPDSLRLLLHLLASAALGQHRINSNLEASGLTDEMIEPSSRVPDATWSEWHNDLMGLGRYDVLQPDFDLVLRHASGVVFQDAHLEAELSNTVWLPGLEQPLTVGSTSVPLDTGVYFTPPALARTLAEEVTNLVRDPRASLRLFDPACGSGELLKECLHLLKLRGHHGRLHVIGWDRSPAAVDMARFVLNWEQRTWSPNRVHVEVVLNDSLLAAPWPDAVDVLVMNPPFRSWQKMEPPEREAVTTILGSSTRPNMAAAFARRAVDALADRGALAMIAPNSLLEASSGRRIRDAIAEIVRPQLIARLGDQTVFSRALVDAGMYVGARGHTSLTPTTILWADSRPNSLNRALRGLRRWRGAEVQPLVEDGFSVYHRADIGTSGAPWVARSLDAWHSYENVRRTRKTVPARTMFDVRQGVRLGNDVFVLDRSQFDHLRTEERSYFRPAVMNPSIADGQIRSTYYVFYPYTEGLPTIETEQALQERLPTYYEEYLTPAKSKLSARKTLQKANLKWWDLLRHRSWQTERRPKIVSKYFGGARSFAFDSTGEFVAVVGNAWILKPGTVDTTITDAEVYLALLTYLSSRISTGLIKYLSVQVSGGQWDLSNKYVGALPVPKLSRLKPAELVGLAQMGASISSGDVESWPDVDELVASVLFG